MSRLLLALLFISFRFLLSNEIYSIPVQDIVYRIETFHRFDRIVMSRAHSPLASGAPELPAMTSTYLLPRGQRLKDVKILSAEWEDLPGCYQIYPKQEELRIGETYHFTEPDARIYGSSALYPHEIIVSAHTGTMRGYHVAQVSIVPFRYRPREGKLSLLKELKIEIETEPCEPGVFPRRQTRLVKNAFEKFLSSIVVNKGALDDALRSPPSYIEENPDDLTPTDLPSLLGPPVDFLIVTTDAQVDGYKDFARFKKLLGYNTAIKTVSWVRQHYTGVDDAERIRNFVKDAMENWGVAYVLMGGDVPEIPTRWIWMLPIYNQWPVHAVTDLYFSDLDGNWNFDGDERFGETADLLDLYPDVFVGRLPTTSNDEVRQYLCKIHSYVFPTTTNTQIKALFFSSDFVVPDDAYQMALRLSNHFPPWFMKDFLNEKPLQDLKDSLYVGYNIITGLGHGDVNIMRVKTSPTEYATNFFFDSLTNADHALMIVSTCYTNPFQSDCLSKHWIMNPSGGGIGYIGPTMPCETYLHESYLVHLFDSLFYFPLSEVNAISKIPYIPDAQWDNWYRLYQFSLSLLGDPTLVVWDSIPTQYTAITVMPDTIQVGSDTVMLSIEPNVSSTVILYKEGETYTRLVAQNGSVSCEVRTESSGYLKYTVCDTVLAGRYIPFIDSIRVEPLASYCVYEDCVIIDSLDNGNGVINPGENIFMYCEVRNVGGVAASGVWGQLLCADSQLTVVVDTTSFVNIEPGEVSRCLTPFHIQVSGVMPDEHDFNFSLVLGYSGSVSEDSFQVVGLAPVLAHFGQGVDVIGDTVGFVLSVVNYGHAIADSVLGVVSALSDTVVVLDSVVLLPWVGVNGVACSEPDSFWVYLVDSGCVRLNLRLYDQGHEVVNREFWVDEPCQVAMIWSRGAETSVVLGWSQVSGVSGYRVYRAVDRRGPYVLLDNHLVGVCLYEDDAVQAGLDYYYYVVAVDSSMNCSVSSDTVMGRMNPAYAPGWPRSVYDYLFASPNFGDLDLFYPGLEVVVCGKDGNVYAWHCDGTPMLGDGRIFSIDDAIWSSPGIGDLNEDGSLEIVFGVRRGSDNVYVIDYQGNLLAGWPRTVSSGVLGSPVLGDIDGDGDVEVFVWTQGADIYAFHHDGSGVYSQDGLFQQFSGFALGSLALGDVDGNGELEIVCCGGSMSDSLYVWDRYGNEVSGFPVYIQAGFLPYSVVLGDVCGDSRLEVCFYADSTERVYVVNADGEICWFRELGAVADVEGSPVIADVTGDEEAEVICGYQEGFVVFDSLGNILPGFPDTGYHDAKVPVIADVEGYGAMAMVVGSADWHVYGYGLGGEQALGFPIQCSNRIEASPAVYDLDEDGRLELMVGPFDYAFHVFDLSSSAWEWPRFRYDPYNSGTYRSGHYPGVAAHEEKVLCAVGLLVTPNPFRQMADIRYQLTKEVDSPDTEIGLLSRSMRDLSTKPELRENRHRQKSVVSLKIYDATGRLVKSFPRSTLDAAHPTHITWLGDDNHGRVVSAGVYFVRLEDADKEITQKIVKIK